MNKTVEKGLSQNIKEGVFIGINTNKAPVFLAGYSNKNTNNLIIIITKSR